MTDSQAFEKAFYEAFERRYGQKMEEMKMHKFMYFTQRESLMLHDIPAFSEEFFGWKYGPVLKSVRSSYRQCPDDPFYAAGGLLSRNDEKLVEAVLDRYGNCSAWELSELTHREYSWKRSRKGLSPDENGSTKVELNAIKVDAARELSGRKQKVSLL
ncbi:MAG: DUF4065 domain-containing protein [Lachnospiraceae bacterium]|nr:DUF4065 domain-containing protein [Lachnospiraceae bacterium]